LKNAKTSQKNDSGSQGFEIRGKVERVWTNNTGEKDEQIIAEKKAIKWERFCELAPNKVVPMEVGQ